MKGIMGEKWVEMDAVTDKSKCMYPHKDEWKPDTSGPGYITGLRLFVWSTKIGRPQVVASILHTLIASIDFVCPSTPGRQNVTQTHAPHTHTWQHSSRVADKSEGLFPVFQTKTSLSHSLLLFSLHSLSVQCLFRGQTTKTRGFPRFNLCEDKAEISSLSIALAVRLFPQQWAVSGWPCKASDHKIRH